MLIEAFRIATDPLVLADLRSRLASVRLSDAVIDDWSYGTSPAALRELVARWGAYDRGVGPAPRPLLLANGWPSSFVEYLPIVNQLANPGAYGGDPRDAFHVVIPAMPGYGFSDRPVAPKAVRAVDLYKTLMTEGLGYATFAVAGSDIGTGVATRLALYYADSVSAIHICGTAPPPLERRTAPHSEAERIYLAARERWEREEGAYAAIASTRPQTLAFALADSPAGLASWILDKFHAWSDRRERDVLEIFGDALLDNLTLYWMTETIGSSMRRYYESKRWSQPFAASDFVQVPTSVFVLPGDIEQPPREWAERLYNVERYVVAERGGHFPALEIPQIYCAELQAAFRNVVASA